MWFALIVQCKQKHMEAIAAVMSLKSKATESVLSLAEDQASLLPKD